MRECSDFEKSVIKYLTNKKTREEAVFLFLRDNILGEKYAISIQKNQKKIIFYREKGISDDEFLQKRQEVLEYFSLIKYLSENRFLLIADKLENGEAPKLINDTLNLTAKTTLKMNDLAINALMTPVCDKDNNLISLPQDTQTLFQCEKGYEINTSIATDIYDLLMKYYLYVSQELRNFASNKFVTYETKQLKYARAMFFISLVMLFVSVFFNMGLVKSVATFIGKTIAENEIQCVTPTCKESINQ